VANTCQLASINVSYSYRRRQWASSCNAQCTSDYQLPPIINYLRLSITSDYQSPPIINYLRLSITSDYQLPPIINYLRLSITSDYQLPQIINYLRLSITSDYQLPPIINYLRLSITFDYQLPPIISYLRLSITSDYQLPPIINYLRLSINFAKSRWSYERTQPYFPPHPCVFVTDGNSSRDKVGLTNTCTENHTTHIRFPAQISMFSKTGTVRIMLTLKRVRVAVVTVEKQ